REDYDRQNWGGARGDYGSRAYGGRPDERGMGRGGRGRGDRGWWDRAADEVLSWFGDEDGGRRRRIDDLREGRGYGPGQFPGRGPHDPRVRHVRRGRRVHDRQGVEGRGQRLKPSRPLRVLQRPLRLREIYSTAKGAGGLAKGGKDSRATRPAAALEF